MGMMLPSSLTPLFIRDFPNLEYLSTKGFESLASLQLLLLQSCLKLASFPNSLPPSLLELYVIDCPLLKKNYEKNKRQVRSKIDNIPCVKIDMKSAFKPENDSEENGMDSDEEETYDDLDEEEMYDDDPEEEEKDTDCEEEETDSGSEVEDEG
ncbi:hypothetical protein JCGZ_16869 [Jatropha curcas]|uniref:Uncharacterized protein n=1 Tax=Jatropha curcas TaxID=180498 RepID=A0A067L576_JATCU|nr:leiomodin-3 [Jatropha curcas]KDP43582.1 hypothetical protein JCGZ_16869 [Jatropha curcas]